MTLPKRIRALTLWPEWAWAIHFLDKRVENRTWALPVDEWFALHAGKYMGGKPTGSAAAAGMGSLLHMIDRAGWEVLDMGARWGDRPEAIVRPEHKQLDVWANHIKTSEILGLFRVIRTEAPMEGDLTGWRVPDQTGNVFEYRPLKASIPCSGAQGLWTVKPEIEAQIRADVRAR